MNFELIIRNANIIDGSGSAATRGDVAISNGKIVAIGTINGSADRTFDANGLCLAPGFIDHHTHYDAQICWDPLLTPSSWHGVTSVVLGNCGLGVAPCKPDRRHVAVDDLVIIEGMPRSAIEAGLDWQWQSFPEYMQAVTEKGIGINVGFLAPITPFRHFVMGDDAIERPANQQEQQQIGDLLSESFAAGALGFATSKLAVDVGYKGKPVASRLASTPELESYAKRLKQAGGGTIQIALISQTGKLSDYEANLLDRLLTASDGPVVWLCLHTDNNDPELPLRTLQEHDQLISRGAVPEVCCRPLMIQFNLNSPFAFAHLDCVGPLFLMSPEQKIEQFQDPQFRQTFRDQLALPGLISGDIWPYIQVHASELQQHQGLINRSLAEIAAERQIDPLDLMLDLAIESELNIDFQFAATNNHETEIGKLLADPRTTIGLSDGGAHADMLCDAGYATYTLGRYSRELSAITLEQAIKRLTSDQAKLFGITNRGLIKTGYAADLVLFDPETVGSPKTPEWADDLPGGNRRMITRPTGIEAVLVNGEFLFEQGNYCDNLPGQRIFGDRKQAKKLTN